MKAILIVWLATHQLTVTLESTRLSKADCKEKLAEMRATVKASGLDYEIKKATCKRRR